QRSTYPFRPGVRKLAQGYTRVPFSLDPSGEFLGPLPQVVAQLDRTFQARGNNVPVDPSLSAEYQNTVGLAVIPAAPPDIGQREINVRPTPKEVRGRRDSARNASSHLEAKARPALSSHEAAALIFRR